LGYGGSLLIALEDEVEGPGELGTTTTPNPGLAVPGRLVAFAEAGQQWPFRLGEAVAEEQAVRLVVIGDEMGLAIVVVQQTFLEVAAAQAGRLALGRQSDLDVEWIVLVSTGWNPGRDQDHGGVLVGQESLTVLDAPLAELIFQESTEFTRRGAATGPF